MTYDEDKEPPRCGVGFTSTGKDDPMIAACEWHDQAYKKDSFMQRNFSRKFVDDWFKRQMDEIAKGQTRLKIRSALYHKIVRLVGGFFYEGKK